MEKTIKNLAAAFIGESQARNRYLFYSKIASKEGFEQIAQIFRLTADQEKEHATWLFKLINQLKEKQSDQDFSEIKVDSVPVPTTLGETKQNLKAAIAGENHEHTTMYPEFAEMAQQENLPEIASRLRSIAKAEAHHEERYQKLLDQLEKNTLFKKDKEVEWACLECGYVHLGKEAPLKCPSCDHAQGFYRLKCEEF